MKTGNILVIGGAGYVGSHFARYAAEKGFSPTIADNLSKGWREAIRGLEFFQLDLNDRAAIGSHLSEHHYDAVFHFAASALVGESVEDPALYYRNNVAAALNMLEAMRETGHNRLVFSSSCAVYGIPDRVPIGEGHPKGPISPYGRSKLIIEWMLEDFQAAYGIRSAALRYFNAAGCEPSHGLGEDHRPETHLIPNVARYALGIGPELIIFGDDYPTPDGTCVRDYIHVTDLAEAHLKALEKLDHTPLIQVNLGTGVGLSNLQIVEAVERAVGKPLQRKFGPRRPGDPPELVADPTLARELLDWRPSRSQLDSVVHEVVEWFRSHPKGYQG